jgi:hypothetical protein
MQQIIKDQQVIDNYKKVVSELPNLTKEDSNFSEWLEVVFKIYTLGTIDVPMTACGGKMPWWEILYIPTAEMVENYRKDERIIGLYRELYDDGKTPSIAIDLMW